MDQDIDEGAGGVRRSVALGRVSMSGVRPPLAGRTIVLRRMAEALADDEWPCEVLWLHGHVGQGKTALLYAWQAQAREAGIETRMLSWSDATRQQLAERRPAPNRRLVLLDDYISSPASDRWLCREVLARVEPHTMFVVACHTPPPPDCVADPAHPIELEGVTLGPLGEADARQLLSQRRVPAVHIDAIVRFAAGSPLLLVLAASHAPTHEGATFAPQHSVPLASAILRAICPDSDAEHRELLDALAVVRRGTPMLLGAMLDRPVAIQQPMPPGMLARGSGWHIQPHVRRALLLEMRALRPATLARLRQAVLQHLVDELLADGAGPDAHLACLLYMCRDIPQIRRAFHWDEVASFVAGTGEGRAPTVAESLRQHAHRDETLLEWIAANPDELTWFQRSVDTLCTGASLTLRLPPGEGAILPTDSITRAVLRDLDTRRDRLREGEEGVFVRLWMSLQPDTFQDSGLFQSFLMRQIILTSLRTRSLALVYFWVADRPAWRALADAAGCGWVDLGSSAEDGEGVMVYDTRARPVRLVLEAARSDRNGASPHGGVLRRRLPSLKVLQQQEFTQAVRDALRHFDDPYELANNPLLGSRVVAEQSLPSACAVAGLRSLLLAASAELEASPRLERPYQTLLHTYLEPAATQEQAAAELGMPFSTYRRHLQAAVDRVTAWLWRRELQGALP